MVAEADLALGVADLDTWRGIAPPGRATLAVEEAVEVVFGVGRLVIWLGIAAWKEGDLVVVAEAAAAVEKALALIVGSQGILRGNVLKLQVEVKKGLLHFAKGEKRWNSTYSLFLHLLTVINLLLLLFRGSLYIWQKKDVFGFL